MNPSEDQKQAAPATPEPVNGLSKPGRRRLLRAGLSAAPAVLALKATPVLACNCKSPSGFSVSGNLSHTGSLNCSNPTSKPSVWRTNCGGNPKCYTGTSWRTTNKFYTNCNLKANSSYPDQALDTCLGLGDTTSPQALITACYLEATRSGSADCSTGFPNTTLISNIWNGYLANSYSPSAGVTWQQPQILNYLKYLTGQL